MSRALFVSERASHACSQTYVTLIQATSLHRCVAARSRIFFVFLVHQAQRFWMCQSRHMRVLWMCQSRHTQVLPHIFECVNRDTRGFYPTYLNVSIKTHAGLTPHIWLCPHETHAGSTPPSHCVPPQHNTSYHTDTSECDIYTMWSASGFFIVSEVVSTHVSTVIKINRQNSEQC